MSYDLTCSWRDALVPSPGRRNRVGYLGSFQGLDLGEFLKPDLSVVSPYSGTPEYTGLTAGNSNPPKVNCVGIIESLAYNGGAADPICITAYVSQENAHTLKARMKGTLKTTKITSLSWWIIDYDEISKRWFEAAFPKHPATVSGQLHAAGGKNVSLQVADDPTRAAPNVDVNFYNVYFEIVPAANSIHALQFATSPDRRVLVNWGLAVGSTIGSITAT
jgi:hypothetical protein